MEKKYRYSRIVRKITQMLAGLNVPTSFLEYRTNESGALVSHLVHLADIIESALEGETIKKSEVERLRKIEADSVPKNAFANAAQYGINQEKLAKQYDSEASMWCKHTVQLLQEKASLKDKLWAAEQEIHDLKHNLEFAQNLADDAIRSNTEQIDPPACLKPLDAMTWTTTYVYSGVTYPL